MHYHKLGVDDAGESHWETVEVTLSERVFAPPAQNIHLSDPEPCARVVFLRLPAGWDEPIHPTPARQRLVCLAGAVRVTASDGEAREIGPGDVWQMQDTWGKGHHTRVISDADFEAMVVQFA